MAHSTVALHTLALLVCGAPCFLAIHNHGNPPPPHMILSPGLCTLVYIKREAHAAEIALASESPLCRVFTDVYENRNMVNAMIRDFNGDGFAGLASSLRVSAKSCGVLRVC